MASDAHAHPYDLFRAAPEAEASRRRHGVACAASAWGDCDFAFNEKIAKASPPSAPVALCFGVHPQLPLVSKNSVQNSIHLLETLACEKRIDALGECGFDLFNAAYRATEDIQNKLFSLHIDLAARYDLPLVLHVRRAMHKIFEQTKTLKKIKAVVFHSYSGTLGEARSLLRRGVNAFFSFGNALLLRHKEARRACAALEESRLLFETDAPYQPAKNAPLSEAGETRKEARGYSVHTDIYAIINEAAVLRGGGDGDGGGGEGSRQTPFLAAFLEEQSDNNFREVYGLGPRMGRL